MINRYSLWIAAAILTGVFLHPMLGFAVFFFPAVILFCIHEGGGSL